MAGTDRVVPVEHEATASPLQQAPPQRALEQVQPHQRLGPCPHRAGCTNAGPVPLDLSNSLGNQFVVGSMRPAMERQGEAQGSLLTCRQQHAVAAEILQPDPPCAQFAKQAFEAGQPAQLARQKMVALQCWIMAGRLRAIDRCEGYCAAMPGSPAQEDQPRPTRTKRPLRDGRSVRIAPSGAASSIGRSSA